MHNVIKKACDKKVIFLRTCPIFLCLIPKRLLFENILLTFLKLLSVYILQTANEKAIGHIFTSRFEEKKSKIISHIFVVENHRIVLGKS